MSQVLVTGAAGFIGRALVPSLGQLGHTVSAAVRHTGEDPPGWLTRLPATTVVEADMSSPSKVADTVLETRPDIIINLAVSRSSDPERARAVNITGFTALLDAAAQLDAHVIHLGSSTELASNESGGALGATKADAARLLSERITSGHIRGCMLRPFLVHGPGEPPHRLLPTAIRAAVTGFAMPLTCPGAARDHLHIDDVVDAILAAVRTGLNDPRPIDVCTGVSTTNEGLLDLVQQLMARPIDRRVGQFPQRPWDRPHWTADPSRVTALIGRPPTPLPATVADVIRAMTVSVVVPMYHTRDTLDELHARIIDSLPPDIPTEIIYVDDGCDLGSGAAIDALAAADPRVIALHHHANLGQHQAIQTGLAASTGHEVVVLDADLQDPPEAMPELLSRLRHGDVDAVFAGRRGTYEGRGRMLSGHAFKWVLHHLTGTPTDAGGYLAMSRSLVDDIAGARRSGPYLLARIAHTRRPTVSVPVRRHRRTVGHSATGTATRMRLAGQAIRAAAKTGSR